GAALESALAAARQWNDREGEGAVLLNLGSVAEAEGDLDEALRVARRAAEIGHAVGNAEMESTGWNNQAALHNDRGDLQSALREFEKAVEVAHRGSLLRPEATPEGRRRAGPSRGDPRGPILRPLLPGALPGGSGSDAPVRRRVQSGRPGHPGCHDAQERRSVSLRAGRQSGRDEGAGNGR